MPLTMVRGLSLYHEELGEGPPLLFLSGLGGDVRAFGATIRHFSGRFRAITLDARDAGRSGRMVGEYTLEDVAEDVAGWLKEHSISRVHVVGHSMGGLVAQVLAAGWPGLVSSLVLASSHAGGDPWRRAVVASWISMREHASAGEFTLWTLPWLAGRGFFSDPMGSEGMVRFAEGDPYRQSPDAFARQARAILAFDGVDPSRLAMPVLVLSGEQDLVNPPSVARELAEKLPNAELVLIPGVGHLPHIENGRAFRAAIDAFLGRVAS